jgi:ribosome biogenesis SPOUT family RNA methylase Rps3
LLIAAFAILSTVLLVLDDERELEPEDDVRDDVFLAGRAIFDLLRRGKDNLLP